MSKASSRVKLTWEDGRVVGATFETFLPPQSAQGVSALLDAWADIDKRFGYPIDVEDGDDETPQTK